MCKCQRSVDIVVFVIGLVVVYLFIYLLRKFAKMIVMSLTC